MVSGNPGAGRGGPRRRAQSVYSVVLGLILVLAAASVEAATLTLTWTDTATGESEWQVERRAMPGGSYQAVTTLAANSTQYVDGSYDGVTSYRYRVRAVIGGVGQPYSREVCVPIACDPPAPGVPHASGQGTPAAISLSASVASGLVPWSGILAPSRATDWTTAGATVIARTTPCRTAACDVLCGSSVSDTVCTSTGATISTATLNAAVSSAPANTVVRIPAGTFTAADGFTFQKSDITVRGMGANATKIFMNGNTGNSICGIGGADVGVVRMCSGATGKPSESNMTHSNVAVSASAWTQGQTVFTLGTVADLAAGGVGVGSMLLFDQQNDASDGYPATGDLYVCESATTGCSNQGGNQWGRSGYSQVEVKRVVAINGLAVTVAPGLQAPNWRGNRLHSVHWNSPLLKNVGLEDLTIDKTASSVAGVFIKDATNVWVRGLRIIDTNNTGAGGTNHFKLIMASHVTIESNYLYGPRTVSFDQYPINDSLVSSIVFQNNILHGNISGVVPNDPGTGNVYAYNYINGARGWGADIRLHSGTIMLPLVEGNDASMFGGDVIHGPHYLGTVFRNLFWPGESNGSQVWGSSIILCSQNRFFNLVGNVLSGTITNYQRNCGNGTTCSYPDNPSGDAFALGSPGSGSGTATTQDANVGRTTLRWGNWDKVTSTGDTGTDDQTGTRYVAGENPSGITNFPSLASPTQHTSGWPASFYLSAAPAWWATAYGTPQWPAIGPDVSNGNNTNTVANPTGGHADKIPARLCYEGATTDGAYSVSPAIRVFNRATCYPGS